MEAGLNACCPNERGRTRLRCAAGARLVGRGATLAGGEGLMLAEEADRLIDQAAQPDIPALFALADNFRASPTGWTCGAIPSLRRWPRRIRARALGGNPN